MLSEFMSRWSRTITILISNLPWTRKFSQLFKNTGGEDLFLPSSRVGHALRPVFMLLLVKIWQVSSCGKLMQHRSWNLFTLTAEADRVLCQLVMFLNCLFPLDVQHEIQVLSRVFCYSWLVCLLVFWFRDASLVIVGNPISDGIKIVNRFWRYLIAFRSCISNGKRE